MIESTEVEWSEHAAEGADRYLLTWLDVREIARTGDGWKRETDQQGKSVDGWKDSVVGRDCRGRMMYMCGKRMKDGRNVYWRVITIHEAKP